MAWSYRSLAEIRDDLISALAVADPDIDTSEGADAWILSNACAGLFAELQARDVDLSRAILPSTATGDDLDQHAILWLGADNDRLEASQWFGTIELTAEAGATPAVPLNQALTASDGTEYQTTEAVIAGDWSGPGGTVVVTAESVDEHIGTTGNKADATVLVVSSPPAGLSSSALIDSTTTAALDEEDDEHLRGRILDITAGRPGAGNPADYIVWAKSVAGCYEAFAYPIWDGLGTVTVVGLGAPHDRILPAAGAGNVLDQVEDAIEAARPCGVVVTVQPATANAVTVAATVRCVSGYEPGWTGTFTTSAGAHTITRVYLTADPTGTISVGDWIVVPIGASNFSCCRQVTDVQTGASHYCDVGVAFVDEDGDETAPSNADTVRPGTSFYNDMIEAIRDVFDTLGPSASTGAADTQRWPAPEASWPHRLYLSDLYAAFESVTGVHSVDITAPAANETNEVAPTADPELLTFNPAVVITWGAV